MAGLMQRTMTIIKARYSTLLNRAERPSETLDYSYERQLELLQNVKRGVADVVTAKKRLQLQTQGLEQNDVKLDTKARPAGTRAQVRGSAAAPGSRRAGQAARGAAGEARRERATALHAGRSVPLRAGGDQSAVLGRRGAGTERRGCDGNRRPDGRHRRGDSARARQDRGDAVSRRRDRRANGVGRARRCHLRPDAARPRAGTDGLGIASRGRPRKAEEGSRFRRPGRTEGDREVAVLVPFRAPCVRIWALGSRTG